jgi:hypothetical protein
MREQASLQLLQSGLGGKQQALATGLLWDVLCNVVLIWTIWPE